MRATFLWVMTFLVLTAQAASAGVPVEEIRRVLREGSLFSPSEASLAALSETDLEKNLKKIDAHAHYFKAHEYQSSFLFRGGWIGIGARLLAGDGDYILSVFQGGSADRAGVPDRSVLLEVDGKKITGLTSSEIVDRVRGKAGTKVRLTVKGTDGTRITRTVLREAFRPLDVEVAQPGDRHVLRIRDFIGSLTRSALIATIDFVQAKEKRKEIPGQALLIIDLRDAPGGDLYEALDIAGLFLPAGTPLGTLRGPGGESRAVEAPAGPKYDMPLALIVGPDTASAAEIFAGTLQANDRAVLIGQRTYGKCTSQTDARLSDGSVLRFTNREMAFPDGHSCSGSGLSPDREMDGRALADVSNVVDTVRKLLVD